MVSSSDIIKIANEYKAYVVKNIKTPAKITINKQTYTLQQCAYLFSKFISKPNTNVDLKFTIKGAPSPGGDTINEKIYTKDFTSMAERCAKYIETNKALPNYVTTTNSKKKTLIQLYIFNCAKIIVYYGNNKKMPAHSLFNSADLKPKTTTTTTTKASPKCTNPYQFTPYDSQNGCNHMGQDTGYFCGPSMIQKMLYELGITGISQEQLASWAGTTSYGTDHYGIETAIAKAAKTKGVKLTVKWYSLSDFSWKSLAELGCRNDTSFGCHLLYRSQYGHYEKPLTIDTSKEQIKVINSLGSKCGNCYCGYVEARNFSLQRAYINGISQKSILVIKKG